MRKQFNIGPYKIEYDPKEVNIESEEAQKFLSDFKDKVQNKTLSAEEEGYLLLYYEDGKLILSE
ncbi:MAG: hypothetical protein J6O00_10445 [Clostridiales bacterium]|nr:hypothetical protein [Clostridiales bacterium]